MVGRDLHVDLGRRSRSPEDRPRPLEGVVRDGRDVALGARPTLRTAHPAPDRLGALLRVERVLALGVEVGDGVGGDCGGVAVVGGDLAEVVSVHAVEAEVLTLVLE